MLALVSLINPIRSYEEKSRLIHKVLTEHMRTNGQQTPVAAFSQDGCVFLGKSRAENAHQRPHCLCYALCHKHKVDHSRGMCQPEMFHYSTWRKLTTTLQKEKEQVKRLEKENYPNTTFSHKTNNFWVGMRVTYCVPEAVILVHMSCTGAKFDAVT